MRKDDMMCHYVGRIFDIFVPTGTCSILASKMGVVERIFVGFIHSDPVLHTVSK